MLRLNTIKAQPGAHRNTKRLGRGKGSGHGKTAGRGTKGQGSRKSGNVRAGFEGGQTPMYRRLPKQGFTNIFARSKAVLNVGQLERYDAALSEISLDSLRKAGKVKGRHDQLVILGTGELKRALTVKAHKVSPSAKEKIEKAGGKIEMIAIPKPVGKPKKRERATAAKA